MLALERHRQIIETLERHGSVRTIDLAERLSVTDETIRRDLERLEKDGQLQRTHGGAIQSNKIELRERTFDERNVENFEAKQAIARVALKLIDPEESIFVDASSTALQLVMLLGDFPLRVVTHSLYVAECLRHKANVDLVLAGGRFDRTSRSFLGAETLLALKRYRIHKAFLSGNGIEPSLGASEINEDQALLKEVVRDRTTNFIYMADHSKLGKSSSFYFAETSAITTFITDSSPDHPVLREISDAMVEVLTT